MRPCSFLFNSVRFQIDVLGNEVLDHFLVYLSCYCETRYQYDLAVTWNGTHREVTDEFLWASISLPLLRWSQLLIHTSGSRYLCNFDTSPTQICVAFSDVFHFGRQLRVSEWSLLETASAYDGVQVECFMSTESFFHCLSAFLRKEAYCSFTKIHLFLSWSCKLRF